ncbi:MAG: C39 family peptidase [Candidatus Kerfeldbacteria bacterium]|nr:C39 family peptidase [Candidatus Kerfeldbacteria bacterium]
MSTPLIIKPFRQTNKDYCGPASLKMLLSYYGKRVTEARLATLSQATRRFGTLHAGMIRAVQLLGGTVMSGPHGTIHELRHWVQEKRLPVLVGWYDVDYDHYSVVYHLTARDIFLRDPAEDSGQTVMPIRRFMPIWYDYTGTTRLWKVQRWYLVITGIGAPARRTTRG